MSMLSRFSPTAQGGNEAAQAQDMVEMAVGKQHFVEPFKAEAALQNLALCALAAVEQKIGIGDG